MRTIVTPIFTYDLRTGIQETLENTPALFRLVCSAVCAVGARSRYPRAYHGHHAPIRYTKDNVEISVDAVMW